MALLCRRCPLHEHLCKPHSDDDDARVLCRCFLGFEKHDMAVCWYVVVSRKNGQDEASRQEER
jgi:hypothetical protein